MDADEAELRARLARLSLEEKIHLLTGAAEPGGRLPTTFPASEEGVPSPVPDEDGVLRCSEGAAIGHRHYTSDQIAYPFGHGVGYATWEYGPLTAPGTWRR